MVERENAEWEIHLRPDRESNRLLQLQSCHRWAIQPDQALKHKHPRPLGRTCVAVQFSLAISEQKAT